MAVFFTADTHFGSERTWRFSRRPEDSPEDFDWWFINRWNNIVNSEDTVYHLGDIGNLQLFNELQGKFHIVPGNYDKGHIDEISKMPTVWEIVTPNSDIEVNGTVYRLIHEPEFGFAKGNPFFLFGHIHEKQMVKRNGLNVGIDCHHYNPVGMDTIEFYRNAILNHYDENCFQDMVGDKTSIELLRNFCYII